MPDFLSKEQLNNVTNIKEIKKIFIIINYSANISSAKFFILESDLIIHLILFLLPYF